MEMELDWGSLLSTAGGGGIALIACKALITKALRDLELVTKKVNDTLQHISAITVKISHLDKISDLVQSHDRDITVLQSRVDHEFKKRRLYQNSEKRVRDIKS